MDVKKLELDRIDAENRQNLNYEKGLILLDSIFSQQGLLAQELEGYEERSGQIAMAHQVFKAYLEDKIAFTEAGTGIGKSLAYLVSALLWAVKCQERTVISTHTIALQHQLVEKDIPFLKKVLDVDVDVVIAKGMQNYLCLRKLEESDHQTRELDHLRIWAEQTSSGCRTSLSFFVSPSDWEQAAAHPDDCSSSNCPYFRSCFFFKARRQAEEAQIVVVNHHLLLHDLRAKEEEEKAILPSFQRLILDEGHHLEEVGREVFSDRVDWVGLIKLLHRFFLYGNEPEGRIPLLEKVLQKSAQALHLLAIDLPAQRNEILRKIEQAFFLLKEFIHIPNVTENWVSDRSQVFSHVRYTPVVQKEKRYRVHNRWNEEPGWKELAVVFKETADLILKWVLSWQTLCREGSPEEAVIAETLLLASRLEKQVHFLYRFFSLDERLSGHVRWIEIKEEKNIQLIEATLDLAEKMRTIVFEPLRTTALCSATLCQGKDFSFMKRHLGLQHKEISEAAFDSPFDYENRMQFLVPSDLPEPTTKEFSQQAIEAIAKLVQASQGGALVLFTATDMLREAHAALAVRRELKEYLFLRQGELGRSALLERFYENQKAVILGVDSFWEGVDIPGEALRLVILVKLPFHPLQDPLIEALQEKIATEGGSPFYEYSVPKAITKFKQGFGRLMRRKEDRGLVGCLDKRLFTKSYGKQFLKNLPNCQKIFQPLEHMITITNKFFT